MFSIYDLYVIGDVRGDPELGGWRPLPKEFFAKKAPLPAPDSAISLEQAVQLINFEFRYLRLLRAVHKVTFGLLQTQDNFMKGVVQCS